jgi:hypothetical protein
MAIDAKHPQYTKYSGNWILVNDIVDQENLEQYLIYLNPTDYSDENKLRNDAYQERAVFYALTSQTVAGMLGTIFHELPKFEAPENLKYLAKNVDGRGNSIYQQSQAVTKDNLSISRAGLFVTFPKTDGQVSRADIASGFAVAKINHIKAENIINWKETSFGAISKLTLVVIKDVQSEMVDYEIVKTETLRELYIDEDGIYKERIWKKKNASSNDVEWIVDSEATPTDHTGNYFTEIPFTFVGATNNDPDVDVPNMLSMSKLNIAHYRNSADFEDSTWFAGQTQPWMSNVDQDHIDLMKENNMYTGSRNTLAVPENGVFDFATAPPNPMVRQAMSDKVEMMVGIGARMITPGGVAKTAEQTSHEREAQHSSMTVIAANVSGAYMRCLKWVAQFMGVESGELEYELNREFIKSDSTPAELKEIIVGFIAGTIPVKDYIHYMKKYGVFNRGKGDEDYMEELEGAGSDGLNNIEDLEV